MGIFTYLKIGGIALILIIAGCFVYNYKHKQTQIKTEIALKEAAIASLRNVIERRVNL